VILSIPIKEHRKNKRAENEEALFGGGPPGVYIFVLSRHKQNLHQSG
jgi:hypothetical protein